MMRVIAMMTTMVMIIKWLVMLIFTMITIMVRAVVSIVRGSV